MTRALARLSPWLLVLGNVGWIGALLTRRAAGDWNEFANIENQMCVGVIATVLASASVLALRGKALGTRRHFAFSVALTPLIGAAAYLAVSPYAWRIAIGNSIFGHTGMVVPLCLLPLMVVGVAHTLSERRDMETVVLRVGVFATAMGLVGVLWSWCPTFGCHGAAGGHWSSPAIAIAVVDSYGIRAIAETCAGLSCLLAFAAVRRDARSSRWMLLGMGAWWCNHALLDLAALHVAGPIHRGFPLRMPSAELLEILAGVGGFALAACFVGHLLSSLRDGRPVVAWALLPLLLVGASPALAPDAPMGNPDTVAALANATMDKAHFEPVTIVPPQGSAIGPSTSVSARRMWSAIALLSPDALVVIEGERLPTEYDALTGVHVTLVPDVRATVGDLRRAVHRLHPVGSLEVAWRANRLDEVPRDVRWRWPFLERASRDLGARKIHLVPERDGEECEAQAFEPCDETDVPDDMLVGEYLAQHEDDFVFFVAREGGGDGVVTTPGSELPRDLMDTRLLPLESPWPPLLGALFALGAFVFWILRDLLAAALIRRALVRLPTAEGMAEVYPAWVPRERAIPYAVGAADPYRHSPHVVGVASLRACLATLGGHFIRGIPLAFAAIACWLLLVVLAWALWR